MYILNSSHPWLQDHCAVLFKSQSGAGRETKQEAGGVKWGWGGGGQQALAGQLTSFTGPGPGCGQRPAAVLI